MELSRYEQGIDLERAIEEFDAATSDLVIHEPIRDRIHCVVNSNRRWAEALEERYDLHDKIDSNLVEKYLRDVGKCIGFLSEFHRGDDGRDYSTWLSIMNLSVDKSRDLIQRMNGYDR